MPRVLSPLIVVVALLVAGAARTAGQQPLAAQPRAELSGVVAGEDGRRLPGARIVATLESDPAVSAAATSDSQGRFRVGGLPPGLYRVVCSLAGFRVRTERIQMRTGASASLTFTLIATGRGGAVPAPPAGRSGSRPPTPAPPAASAPPPGAEPAPAGAEPPPPPPPPPPPAPPGVFPSPSPEPAAPAAPEGSVSVSVFYATDRQRLAGPVLDYGPVRNSTGALDLGRFDVSVPRDHERGTLERPSLWTFWREDPAQHFVITSRTLQSYGTFYDDIRARIARSTRQDAFVFVHGFNVSFQDAVFRTAQFAYDLQIPIAPILYSWPSAAALSPIGYATDAESNRWTERHLRWFLEDVVRRTGAQRVHLIAHSMGNKALLNALDMMPASTVRRFGQIVLTAPDVDADTFVQLSDAIKRSGERATLYASANDVALSASKRLQGGYRRAGDTNGGVVVVPGIDTIDVSALRTDFLGHSPQGSGSVISDIFLLITQGLEPARRPGLRTAGVAPSLFWRFVP